MIKDEIYKRYYRPEDRGYSKTLCEAIGVLNSRGLIDERDLYFIELCESLNKTHKMFSYKWMKQTGQARLKMLMNLMK